MASFGQYRARAMAATRAPSAQPDRARRAPHEPDPPRRDRVPRRLEDLRVAATSAWTTRRSRSRRGEFVFLVGSTGSGKSTIMRLLIKELEADRRAGSVVAGRDLSEIDRKQVPYYRRNIGVVFQDFKLLPNRTVYDNVAYALQVTGALAQGDPRRRCPTSCA